MVPSREGLSGVARDLNERQGHEVNTNGAARTSEERETWSRAVVAAAIVVVASAAAFVLIPNQLIGYLSLRVSPKERDLLVTGWWVLAFVGCCWLFVQLQPRRKR